MYLFERAAFVIGGKVMNDKAGDHSVKNGIRILEGRSESFIPLNVCAAGFLAGNIQYLRVAIQACDFGFGMCLLEHKRQCASTTTEIEDFHLWLDACLLN